MLLKIFCYHDREKIVKGSLDLDCDACTTYAFFKYVELTRFHFRSHH